jgi:methyl-accepting chemotaxis protein
MIRTTFRHQRLHRSIHTSRWQFADAAQTANKAADSAKQMASKATDTASKAAANAQEYASKALEQSQRLAKVIGDTSGKI